MDVATTRLVTCCFSEKAHSRPVQEVSGVSACQPGCGGDLARSREMVVLPVTPRAQRSGHVRGRFGRSFSFKLLLPFGTFRGLDRHSLCTLDSLYVGSCRIPSFSTLDWFCLISESGSSRESSNQKSVVRPSLGWVSFEQWCHDNRGTLARIVSTLVCEARCLTSDLLHCRLPDPSSHVRVVTQ